MLLRSAIPPNSAVTKPVRAVMAVATAFIISTVLLELASIFGAFGLIVVVNSLWPMGSYKP